ncbi:MAG: PD40 domain-containing protein [Chloroflexota bacterium]|nr:MAG: PD40 domain-containing protein [Chloroflexota bacterium]
MKIRIITVFLFVVAIVLVACESPTPTVEVQLPALPTPDVPLIQEIDESIDIWEGSGTTDYFIVVNERNQEEEWQVKMIVSDGDIRTAQRLDFDDEGNLGDPRSIPHEDARAYTVDSLLQRVRQDSLGQGPSLYNLKTSFENTLGFPQFVHAEALPSYTEDGTLELNRRYSYDLNIEVKALMENTFGTAKEPILTLIRSDGPSAWCDTLRIFPDGTSIYLDDCRNEFWQIPTPDSRMLLLEELRTSFGDFDELLTDNNQTRHLRIQGTGSGGPDEAIVEEAWLLASELQEILSEPVGLGLVMGYTYGGEFLGFDVFNKRTLPSQLNKSGELRGALLAPDGDWLAFSDDEGLNVFDVQNQSVELLLPAPEDGYYLPRSWSNSGKLLVTLISESEMLPHGWISLEEREWHELPLPEGKSGYGCDTGAVWSSEGDLIAITGLEYGTPCNSSPGLTVVSIPDQNAEVVVAPILDPFQEDDSQITAGAHTPAWSPDDSWIAFGLDQEPTEAANFPTRIYRVHPDGSNLTPLTSNSQGYATHPVWAKDGSLYYGLSGAGADVDGLYQYLPSENSRVLLLPGTGIHPLSISPDGEFLVFEQAQALNIWRVRLQETIAQITSDEEKVPGFAGWIQMEQSQ